MTPAAKSVPVGTRSTPPTPSITTSIRRGSQFALLRYRTANVNVVPGAPDPGEAEPLISSTTWSALRHVAASTDTGLPSHTNANRTSAAIATPARRSAIRAVDRDMGMLTSRSSGPDASDATSHMPADE
jgi:hypothetical protein